MFFPKHCHGQIPASLVLLPLDKSAARSPLNVRNTPVWIYELEVQTPKRKFDFSEVI